MSFTETAPPDSLGSPPNLGSPNLSATVLRSAEETAELVPAWRELATEINADPDFFFTVIANRPEIIRPHVIKVERDRKLVAILIARLENTIVRARLGYFDLMRARARAIVTVYGGLLGERSEAVCQVLLESLRNALATGEAELLRFSPMPLDDRFHAVAREGARGFLRSRGEEAIIHWQLALPESFESLLAMRSAKARANIRRYERRLEQAFGRDLRFRIIQTADELDGLIPEMEALTDKTYKRALGVGFRNTQDWRSMMMIGSANGWLRIYVLEIRGRLVSYAFGFIYAGKFLRFNSAFDPELSDFRIGRYVHLKMLEDLCLHPAVAVFDYGFGDAEYKREFATDSWREAGITLFAWSMRGAALWTAVRLTETVSQGARQFVRRTGFEQRLKTFSRRALRRKGG